MPSVEDILTYDGDVADVVINYTMLGVVMVVPCVHLCMSNDSKKVGWWWACVFAFLWAFQIGLCLLVDCTGVSIVWNSIWGHLAHDGFKRLFGARTLRALLLVGLAVLGVDAYYAVEAEVLTTIAHVCSLVLGLVLSMGFWRFSKLNIKPEYESIN